MTSDSAQWLGLQQVSEIEWAFELTDPLSRHDGRLYGGTGLAAAVAAMEGRTGRYPLWATVQFAGTAGVGECINLKVEVLASGRRASQVRFTAHAGGREILAGVGATGVHDDSNVPNIQVPKMPEVPGPEHGEPWGSRWKHNLRGTGWTDTAEVIEVEVDPMHTYLWARMRNDVPAGAAELAFMADVVPPSVLRVAGLNGAGTSLDNSIRFGQAIPSEWVLYEFDPLFIAGGYLHGGVRAWSQDGHFLAYASQTASGYAWPAEEDA